jgi:hypothetical protein
MKPTRWNAQRLVTSDGRWVAERNPKAQRWVLWRRVSEGLLTATKMFRTLDALKNHVETKRAEAVVRTAKKIARAALSPSPKEPK